MATVTSQLIVSLLDRVSEPARAIGRAVQQMNRSIRENSAPVGFGDRLSASITRNNRALAEARFGLADAVAGYYTLKGAIGAPIEEAMRFESAMADVKKVVDFPTPQAFQDFQKNLMDLSRDIPLSVTGLGEIAAAAGQAGIAGADLIRFTEAAAKIGVAFDISAADAGDAMAKMMTGLGLTIDEAVSLSDAMNHLSNAQASSAAEILDVVRRVGAQGKMFGFTAEQTAAFGSAMIASGAQSDVAATSFNNMGKALTKGSAATKGQREAYAALGLNAKKVAKQMQEDAVGTTVDVLERISQLPKEQQAAIASQLFGDEARALGPLLTNLDLVRDSLGLVADEASYAGSAFKEFEARNKTFGSAAQRFNNLITNLKINIGNALLPVLSDLITRMTPFVDQIVVLAGKYPNLTAGIVSATAALIGFRAAISGLRFLGLLGKGGALSMLSFAARGLARAAPGAGSFVTGLSGLGGLVGTVSLPVWGTFALAAAAIGGAGLLIWKYWDRLSSIFSGVGQALGEILSPAVEWASEKLSSFNGDIREGVGKIAEYFGGDARTAVEAYDQVMKSAFNFQYIKDAVDGAKTWLSSFFQQETLTDADKEKAKQAGYDFIMSLWNGMKQVANELIAWVSDLGSQLVAPIKNALSTIGSYMPSFGGAEGVTSDPMGSGVDGQRAKGGPISRGGTYLVGERGPELITAGRSGHVNPAGSSGAGATVTIGPFTFHNTKAADASEIVDQVRRAMRDEVRETFRGVFSDTGLRFA